jgi:hypothetical protein
LEPWGFELNPNKLKKTDLSREAGISGPMVTRFSRGKYVSGVLPDRAHGPPGVTPRRKPRTEDA